MDTAAMVVTSVILGVMILTTVIGKYPVVLVGCEGKMEGERIRRKKDISVREKK